MTESQMRAEVKHLHECVEELKQGMAANAAVLKEVHDILASFRVLRAIAGWLGAVGVALTAVIGVVKSIKGG